MGGLWQQVIVAADADLDRCLTLLAKGGFYHAGQVCVSVQRVYVHESIAQEVAERLATLGNAMVVGDPTDAATEVGPLINSNEVDRVESWVREAVDGGARLVCGGERLAGHEAACCARHCNLLNPPPMRCPSEEAPHRSCRRTCATECPACHTPWGPPLIG